MDKDLALERAELAFEAAQALRDSQARYEAHLQTKVSRRVLLALRFPNTDAHDEFTVGIPTVVSSNQLKVAMKKLSWLDRLIIKLALAKSVARSDVQPIEAGRDLASAFEQINDLGGSSSGCDTPRAAS